MVSRPRSIPFSGDVPLSLRETPIPKWSNLTEADANLQKIRKRTKVVLDKLTKYSNNSASFVNFNGTTKEILQSIYKLFSLRSCGGETKYAMYESSNGSLINFRLGLHDANGSNFESGTTNISVYISYTYRSFRGLSKAPYKEYEIKPQTFEENPKFVVDSLVKGVLSAIRGQEFQLDPGVAIQIDTTKTDTIEDILKRYRNRTYKFSDGAKAYGLRVTQIVSCTVEELQIQVKDKGNANYTLLVDKSNRSFLLNGNNRIPVKSARDDTKIWEEMIHCLFKYAYNRSKGIGENKDINCNRNMNKKLIRLTESDLHRIVRESVNRVLNEVQLNELDPRTYASAREKQKQRDAEYRKQMDDYNSKSFLHRMFNKAPEKPKGYGGRAAAFNKAGVSAFNRDYGFDSNYDIGKPTAKSQTLYDDGTLSQTTRFRDSGDYERTEYDFHGNNNLDPDTKNTRPTGRDYGIVTNSYSQPYKDDRVSKRRMDFDDDKNRNGTYFEKGRKIASDMAYGGGEYEKGRGWRNY